MERSALLLAAAPAPVRSGRRSAATLTAEQVQPLLAEAAHRFAAAGEDTAHLRNVAVQVLDLPAGVLGTAAGNTIYLDADAAGWGWFLDATPGDDREFTMPGDQGEQHRMDLLTAVMHELGHLLGHGHEAEGLMAETLAAGVRRTDLAHDPAASRDQLFAQPSNFALDGWLEAWLAEQFPTAKPRAKPWATRSPSG